MFSLEFFLNDTALQLAVAEEVQRRISELPSGGESSGVDAATLQRITHLEEDIVTKADQSQLSGLALKTELPNLSGYALVSQIPDVSGFLTKGTADTFYAAINSVSGGGSSMQWMLLTSPERTVFNPIFPALAAGPHFLAWKTQTSSSAFPLSLIWKPVNNGGGVRADESGGVSGLNVSFQNKSTTGKTYRVHIIWNLGTMGALTSASANNRNLSWSWLQWWQGLADYVPGLNSTTSTMEGYGGAGTTPVKYATHGWTQQNSVSPLHTSSASLIMGPGDCFCIKVWSELGPSGVKAYDAHPWGTNIDGELNRLFIACAEV